MKKKVILFLFTILWMSFIGNSPLASASVNETSGRIEIVNTDFGALSDVLDQYSDVEVNTMAVSGVMDESDFRTLYAFIRSKGVESLDLGSCDAKDGIIPDYAFFDPQIQGVTDENVQILPLARLVLPGNSRTIGQNALSYLRLQDFSLPGQIATLDNNAFVGFDLQGGDLVLPESVTSLGCMSLGMMRNIGTLHVPQSVTYMDEDVFAFSKIGSVILADGLTFIGERAFIQTDVEQIAIPASVTSLGQSAFSGCTAKKIIIGDGVKSIPQFCFLNCAELKEVILGANVEEIHTMSFENTPVLSSIALPKNMKIVYAHSFTNSGLHSVKIESAATVLRPTSFATLNKNLTDIYCFSAKPPTIYEEGLGMAFCDTSDEEWNNYVCRDINVHVPKGCSDKYRSTMGWNWFSNMIDDINISEGLATTQTDKLSIEKTFNTITAVADGDAVVTLEVIGIDGAKRATAAGRGQAVADLTQLAPGVYVVRASDGSNVKTAKIMMND